MSAKHTEGPFWPVPFHVRLATDVTGYPMFAVCGFSGDQKRDLPTLERIATLMQAAPELLAALENYTNHDACDCEPGVGDGCPWCEAKAAIAKATGEA